jgi:hypothetical protein
MLNVHEAIEALAQLIDNLNWQGVLLDKELIEANTALDAISTYIKINEGGSSND